MPRILFFPFSLLFRNFQTLCSYMPVGSQSICNYPEHLPFCLLVAKPLWPSTSCPLFDTLRVSKRTTFQCHCFYSNDIGMLFSWWCASVSQCFAHSWHTAWCHLCRRGGWWLRHFRTSIHIHSLSWSEWGISGQCRTAPGPSWTLLFTLELTIQGGPHPFIWAARRSWSAVSFFSQ